MTTAAIERMIEDTIGKEGRYSDHPSDRGGPTMWGITEQVARANSYRGEMRDLPRGQAVAIYRQVYVIAPGFARVAAISPAVAAELFDTGANMGPSVPALWFQQWLNALNRQGRDYADIPEDADQPRGGIGPRTLEAFKMLRAKRGAEAADAVMLKGLNSDQGAKYKQLARNRTANEDFVFGWLANRVGL
jgi:lysozyme family protein